MRAEGALTDFLLSVWSVVRALWICSIGILLLMSIEALRSCRCPYCARGWAIFPRGNDHVCLSCYRAIGRRIRSTRDDPPRRRLRILK